MIESAIRVQSRVEASFGSKWSTITFPKPEGVIVPKTETVNPVNGVKMGHQTGVRTIHSIEFEFIELKQLRQQGLISSWGALRAARRTLNRQIAKLKVNS